MKSSFGQLGFPFIALAPSQIYDLSCAAKAALPSLLNFGIASSDTHATVLSFLLTILLSPHFSETQSLSSALAPSPFPDEGLDGAHSLS